MSTCLPRAKSSGITTRAVSTVVKTGFRKDPGTLHMIFHGLNELPQAILVRNCDSNQACDTSTNWIFFAMGSAAGVPKKLVYKNKKGGQFTMLYHGWQTELPVSV